MHLALPCWNVGSTPSTRSAATILLVEQKTQSTRFLLKELLEVCTFSSCVSSAHNKHLLSVVTRELCKFDALGNPCKTQTIIELTIAAVPKASDAGVLNMEEAITQQTNVLDSMIPAPSSVKYRVLHNSLPFSFSKIFVWVCLLWLSVTPSLSSVQRIRAEMTLNRPCCELKMLPSCSFSLVVKLSHKFWPVSFENEQAIPEYTRTTLAI
jgi:hypothetical protein